MGSRIRSLAIMAVAATTAMLPPTPATAQLVVEAEPREACEVLRLGDALDVPEWLAFSRTPAIKLDPAGRLYLRGEDPQVTVLDPDGSFVRYIGGEGEGPGEFAHVGGFGFVGDTVWLPQAPTGIAFGAALGDRVWAVGHTEMDVPFIVQYELRAPGTCR